ncbi:hypothetical protein Patl1_00041 [Pistacia atlantica]|uniref:Uncharacterized protein n=1 Tax=Pistacia atlantica TaxID=434234 RepID=A0ACC1C7K9_9ROSI|nr:hypothetical protein Patl1_00041 [Pistacia atlantica]
MANLRTAMDSAFWDQPISSPLTLEGTANSGFPLGLIPSYSNLPQKELGSFSIQSLLLKPSISNWWLGLVGQFRPKKLISNVKREFSNADELEVSMFRDTTKHIFDKSLYSIGVCSQLALTPSSSLLWNTERHGERKGLRHKFMLYHKAWFFYFS